MDHPYIYKFFLLPPFFSATWLQQSTQLSRETGPRIDWNHDGWIEFYKIMSFLGTSISSLVSICLWAVVSAAVAATSKLFCQCSAQLRELQTSMPPRQGKTLKTFLCMLTKRVGLVKKDEKTSLTVHFKFQFSIALLLKISCPCCQHTLVKMDSNTIFFLEDFRPF